MARFEHNFDVVTVFTDCYLLQLVVVNHQPTLEKLSKPAVVRTIVMMTMIMMMMTILAVRMRMVVAITIYNDECRD